MSDPRNDDRQSEGMVTARTQVCADIPMLNDAEKHRLAVEWNDTRTDYPCDQCIHELFEAQVAKTPDAVAVALADRQLSYRELNDRANRLTRYLKKLGVGPARWSASAWSDPRR